MDKKNILTYEGLKKLEDELEDLKVVKRKEVSQKIKEAREQGDLSNTVAIAVYETLRQWGFPALQNEGQLHQFCWDDPISFD